MTNDEAKFILRAFRANGADAASPTFNDALEQAERDPELRAWFARERAHDGAIAAKLAEIAPPVGLRDAIIAGARASTRDRRAWHQPWLFGLAAAAALVIVSVWLWPGRRDVVEPLTQFALVDALEPTPHGSHGSAALALGSALADPSRTIRAGLPIDFAVLEHTGCRTIDVVGKPVVEVCFKRDGAWLHCYVTRCGDFPSLPARHGPQFSQSGEVNAVAWADGVYRIVVAGAVSRDALARLL